jgi:hypothetical protein
VVKAAERFISELLETESPIDQKITIYKGGMKWESE